MDQNLTSQPQDVPQLQIPQPQQQEMMYGSVRQQKRMKYKNILYYLGIAEVILGTISCLLCVATLIGESVWPNNFYGQISSVSPGLWCGGILIASGILGLRTRSNPSRCIYNANMAVSITASVVMGVLVMMSSVLAMLSVAKLVEICHILLAVVGFAGMVIAIVHSAYCCAGVCCIENHYRGSVVYGQGQLSKQPMMQVQLANGQYMMVPYQPVTKPDVQSEQVPNTAPVVSAQMPMTIAAATLNPAPSASLEGLTKPPEYTAYPHQQI